MISIDIDGNTLHILPVIKGLVSEIPKVRDAMNADYDVIGVALGQDQIDAIRMRDTADEPDLSDLDLVYCDMLMDFGDVRLPVPAFTELIDICNERGMKITPLDMEEDEHAELFCEKVGTLELFKEDKIARKALKHSFDMSSPEQFVLNWDRYVNKKLKGTYLMNLEREAFIADAIINSISGNMLAVIDIERVHGVIDLLE